MQTKYSVSKQSHLFITQALIAVLGLMMFTSVSARGGPIFLLGAGVGESQFQLNESKIISNYSTLSNSSTFSDSSTGVKFFGGIQMDQHLSLELAYLQAGDIVPEKPVEIYNFLTLIHWDLQLH